MPPIRTTHRFSTTLLALGLVTALAAIPAAADHASFTVGFEDGPAPIQAMSALAFAPHGVLLIGDAKAGAVVALDTGDLEAGTVKERFAIPDLETRIAAMLGTRASEVLIHDLAVNPISHSTYLAVSRSRGRWESRWQLPNDLSDATVLLRILGDGTLEEVPVEGLRWSRAELADLIDPAKEHPWKKDAKMRAEAITDLAYDNGKIWVAGLSNEEFASALWTLDFPFATDGKTTRTTVEIFHGAHGKWETHSPIRTFVPYQLGGHQQLLAAYLCTPLVTFETETLKDGQHVKGRTVAEFGWGNYPLDMVVYRKEGAERLLIANSNLPLMIVDPADIAAFEGEITAEVGSYTAGVDYEIRSGSGIQQLDLLDDERFVALQRLPGGTLDLVTLSVAAF